MHTDLGYGSVVSLSLSLYTCVTSVQVLLLGLPTGSLAMRIYTKACFNPDACSDVGVSHAISVFCVFLKFITAGSMPKLQLMDDGTEMDPNIII